MRSAAAEWFRAPTGGGGEVPAGVAEIDARTAATFTSANPVLADNVLGIESDTRLMKRGDGATAWNSLSYIAIAAEELIARIDAIKLEDGTDADELAALVTYFADAGGPNLPIPVNSDVWTAPADEFVLPTVGVLRTAEDYVAMTVTAGTPDTTPLDGTAGLNFTLALVGDTNVNVITLTDDSRPRTIVATASGGAWRLTFGGADVKLNMIDGGITVLEGETVVFTVRLVGDDIHAEMISRSGDPDADVVVSPVSNEIALDARSGFRQWSALTANCDLITPAYLTGRWMEWRAVASGGTRTVSFSGFDPSRSYGITGGEVDVESGGIAVIRARSSAGGPEALLAGLATYGRATPSYVAASVVSNNTGAAVTVANSANGDLELLLDGRSGATLATLATDFTSLHTQSQGTELSLRIAYKAISAAEQTPATTAVRRIAFAIRDADITSAIIASSITAGTSTTLTVPSLTLAEPGLVIAGTMRADNVSVDLTAPTTGVALTVIGATGGASALRAGYVTAAAGVWAGQTHTIASDDWIGFAVAIRGEIV